MRSLQQCALFFFFSLFVWPCSLRDYYSVSNRPFDRGTNLITIFPQSPIPFRPCCLLRLRLLTIGRDVRVEQMPIRARRANGPMQSWLKALLILSAASADCFERAVLRRSVSDEWRKVHFAGDQIRSFKFSFERQSSRVTPHIAE